MYDIHRGEWRDLEAESQFAGGRHDIGYCVEDGKAYRSGVIIPDIIGHARFFFFRFLGKAKAWLVDWGVGIISQSDIIRDR